MLKPVTKLTKKEVLGIIRSSVFYETKERIIINMEYDVNNENEEIVGNIEICYFGKENKSKDTDDADRNEVIHFELFKDYRIIFVDDLNDEPVSVNVLATAEYINNNLHIADVNKMVGGE